MKAMLQIHKSFSDTFGDNGNNIDVTDFPGFTFYVPYFRYFGFC